MQYPDLVMAAVVLALCFVGAIGLYLIFIDPFVCMILDGKSVKHCTSFF